MDSDRSASCILLAVCGYGRHIYVYDMCYVSHCKMVWTKEIVDKCDKRLYFFGNFAISVFNAEKQYCISYVCNRYDICVCSGNMEHII